MSNPPHRPKPDPAEPYMPPHQDAPMPYAPPDYSVSPQDRNMGMLAHLLGAFTGWIGPLIIWLIKKDESAFVNDQGKEALNFQLTLVLFYLICAVVMVASCGVLFFLPLVPWILQIVLSIIGAVEANKGRYYRYPMTIRMIS